MLQSKVSELKQELQAAGILEKVSDIKKEESGMTNHLFSFVYGGEKYLIRIPGEGTEHLIDRQQEKDVYMLLKGRGITDDVLYINADNGIKISRYLADSHVCDINNQWEVSACIRHLKQFHDLSLQAEHHFSVYEKICEYEGKCRSLTENIADYQEMRQKIFGLQSKIECDAKSYCLCHIDAVADNFLIQKERIHLIDWEYAAMCDPDIDIAMFCIYAEYDKEGTGRVIDEYYGGKCPEKVRKKIYAYMAAGAFLWVIWAEIKKESGEGFEDYKNRQYQIAKEFYQYAVE